MTYLMISLYLSLNSVLSLPEPSFVSDWKTLKSQSNTQSELIFHHYLNELPIKVHTEVKVRSHGNEIIFPGMGSASTDDETSNTYGGTLTFYDALSVRVLAANPYNGYTTGVVIYTGSSIGWAGPSDVERIYTEAEVRVKVWVESDFPDPDFSHTWTPISIYDSVTYKEINHTISGYPSFAVVQIRTPSGFVAEAQGSASVEQYRPYIQLGGMIYGFSDTAFRLWYPTSSIKSGHYSYETGLILSSYDGWGQNGPTHVLDIIGDFRILAWKFPDYLIDTTVITPGDLELNNFTITNRNLQQDFLSVEVEALDGSSDGFRFYGVGSTVNDGSLGPYGGLIYAYCGQDVMFWRPITGSSSGRIIQIGGFWNDNIEHQSSDNVAIRINSFINWNMPSHISEHKTYYKKCATHKDVLSISGVLWDTAGTSVKCAVSCSNDLQCESFFYHRNNKRCVGYKYTILDPTATKPSAGMRHFVNALYYTEIC